MPSRYTLSDDDEHLVRELVASGRYTSASAVMREGLRLIAERERAGSAALEALRTDIRLGLESGPPEPHDMAEVLAEAKRRRAAGARG